MFPSSAFLILAFKLRRLEDGNNRGGRKLRTALALISMYKTVVQYEKDKHRHALMKNLFKLEVVKICCIEVLKIGKLN